MRRAQATPLASSALEKHDLPLNAFGDINLGSDAVDAHISLVGLNGRRTHAAQSTG